LWRRPGYGVGTGAHPRWLRRHRHRARSHSRPPQTAGRRRSGKRAGRVGTRRVRLAGSLAARAGAGAEPVGLGSRKGRRRDVRRRRSGRRRRCGRGRGARRSRAELHLADAVVHGASLVAQVEQTLGVDVLNGALLALVPHHVALRGPWPVGHAPLPRGGRRRRGERLARGGDLLRGGREGLRQRRRCVGALQHLLQVDQNRPLRRGRLAQGRRDLVELLSLGKQPQDGLLDGRALQLDQVDRLRQPAGELGDLRHMAALGPSQRSERGARVAAA